MLIHYAPRSRYWSLILFETDVCLLCSMRQTITSCALQSGYLSLMLCKTGLYYVCMSLAPRARIPSLLWKWSSYSLHVSITYATLHIYICMLLNVETFFFFFWLPTILLHQKQNKKLLVWFRALDPWFVPSRSSSPRTGWGRLLNLDQNVSLSGSEYIFLSWSEHVSLS